MVGNSSWWSLCQGFDLKGCISYCRFGHGERHKAAKGTRLLAGWHLLIGDCAAVGREGELQAIRAGLKRQLRAQRLAVFRRRHADDALEHAVELGNGTEPR